MLAQSDREQCALALTNYRELLSNRDICEGDCVRGQECPTGGGTKFYIDFQTVDWDL